MSQHTCVVRLLTFSLFAGELPKDLGQLTNLTYFDVSYNAQYEKHENGDDDFDRPIPGTGFAGELYVLVLRTHRTLVDKLRRVVPGRVPKELANLTKLTKLYLHPGNKDLQVPDGAPTDSRGDMHYGNRGQVAAFQACLK